MTSFTDRERAAEAKFVHEEDVRFEQRVQRIKRLAEWGAGRLGLSDPHKRALYVSGIVKAELEEAGAGVSKLRRDFIEAGIVVSDEQLCS